MAGGQYVGVVLISQKYRLFRGEVSDTIWRTLDLICQLFSEK